MTQKVLSIDQSAFVMTLVLSPLVLATLQILHFKYEILIAKLK